MLNIDVYSEEFGEALLPRLNISQKWEFETNGAP